MSQVNIDWDNLPTCGESGIIISPYICQPADGWLPPVEQPPVNEVPLPGTLVLFALGLAVMKVVRR